MSIAFTPMKLGDMEVENRFVHSATYECMAQETGEVTDELVKRYRTLAKGGGRSSHSRLPLCAPLGASC